MACSPRERCWHESQQLDEHSDGSTILHMTVSGLNEVKRWVLGFGCHAEVLAPVELRQEIQKEITTMLDNYS